MFANAWAFLTCYPFVHTRTNTVAHTQGQIPKFQELIPDVSSSWVGRQFGLKQKLTFHDVDEAEEALDAEATIVFQSLLLVRDVSTSSRPAGRGSGGLGPPDEKVIEEEGLHTYTNTQADRNTLQTHDPRGRTDHTKSFKKELFVECSVSLCKSLHSGHLIFVRNESYSNLDVAEVNRVDTHEVGTQRLSPRADAASIDDVIFDPTSRLICTIDTIEHTTEISEISRDDSPRFANVDTVEVQLGHDTDKSTSAGLSWPLRMITTGMTYLELGGNTADGFVFSVEDTSGRKLECMASLDECQAWVRALGDMQVHTHNLTEDEREQLELSHVYNTLRDDLRSVETIYFCNQTIVWTRALWLLIDPYKAYGVLPNVVTAFLYGICFPVVADALCTFVCVENSFGCFWIVQDSDCHTLCTYKPSYAILADTYVHTD